MNDARGVSVINLVLYCTMYFPTSGPTCGDRVPTHVRRSGEDNITPDVFRNAHYSG
jgi:hypothetical protein